MYCSDCLLIQLLVPNCCERPTFFPPKCKFNALIFGVPILPAIELMTQITIIFLGYINNHLVVLKETPYPIIISMVSIYICQDKKYLLQSRKKNRVLLMQCQLQLWKKRANSAKAKSWNEHTPAESKIKRLDSSNDYLTHNTHYINQGTFSSSKDTKKSERWENFVVRAKLIPKSFKYISKSTMKREPNQAKQ